MFECIVGKAKRNPENALEVQTCDQNIYIWLKKFQ